MNLRYLLFGVLVFLLVNPVNAITCNGVNKAKQYSIEGESVESWGYVKLERNDFCVYKFNNRSSAFSETVVFDENSNRITDIELEKIILSYKTFTYLEANYPSIQPTLQEVYNEFIINSHKYSSNLKEIREGVEFYSQFIKLDIPIYGTLKVDAVSALKYLVFDVFFHPNWDEVVERYKSYKETIDQVSIAKQKGWISYDKEVKVFLKESIAIENFIKAIDDKTNSDLYSKFGPLNFEASSKEISQACISEIALIDNRVTKKRERANTEEGNFDLKLKTLLNDIEKSLGKEVDTSSYEQKYCYYTSNKPSRELINKELFQDFIDLSVRSQEDIQQNINKLEKEMNSAKDKFFLFRWITQIRWGVINFTC